MPRQSDLFGVPAKPSKPASRLLRQPEQLGEPSVDSPLKEFARFKMESGKSIVLYHGDCLTGMERFLPEANVDVVVTSPPYNIGVRYGNYDDKIPRKSYLEWMHNWGILVKRVLKPNGSLFLNVGSKPSDPWIPFDVAGQLRHTLVLQNVFHWIKSIYVENTSYDDHTSLAVGHFKPINSKRFVNDAHEYVFHFTQTGKVEIDRLAIGVPYKDESNINRWKSSKSGKRCRTNNWYVPYKTIQKRSSDRPHPASFPPELADMCIRLHGLKRVNLVLDPFVGIGSSALASAWLGKEMIGFDVDEEYLDIAAKALEQFDASVD